MSQRLIPDKAELSRLLAKGMTHREIAAHVSRTTGYPVRRSSISSAIHRAGLSGPNKLYDEEIPWTVKNEHITAYQARMLRLLGRRRKGIQNSVEQDARLDSWLAQLKREHAVVAYTPEVGFVYVDGEPNEKGLPIIEELKI